MEKKMLYKIHVKGRVQGVGFRWSAVIEAKSRSITGYVRNLSDGSVYIEAEGSRENLNAYVEWCKMGPGYGFVDTVDIESSPSVDYPDFRIEH
jgi:acylphosphatase